MNLSKGCYYTIDKDYIWEKGFYVYKTKNEHNQKLKLIIYESCYSTDYSVDWEVAFHIGKTKNKDKDFYNCNINGKDGIKSLIWAKNCIVDFINTFRSINKTTNNKLTVIGTDNRRYNVYKYGLYKLGFKECLFHGTLCLRLKLD